jgi:hypothetical protein
MAQAKLSNLRFVYFIATAGKFFFAVARLADCHGYDLSVAGFFILAWGRFLAKGAWWDLDTVDDFSRNFV